MNPGPTRLSASPGGAQDDVVPACPLVPLVLVVSVLAALTGCATTATTTATGVPSPSVASRAPGANRPAPAATSRPSAPAPARSCAAPDLRASPGTVSRRGTDGEVFVNVTEVVLTNRSRTRCSVRGWVGVTYRGNNIYVDRSTGQGPDHDTVSATRPVQVPSRTPRITLDPGEWTSFEIRWTCCDQWSVAAYRAELRLPGDDRPIPLLWGEGGGPIIEGETEVEQWVGAIGVPLENATAG